VDLRGPFYISLYNVKPVSHDKAYICARPLKARGPRQKPMLPMPKTASGQHSRSHAGMQSRYLRFTVAVPDCDEV
jgi:hypothetical protein